jgi:hypothetical protein
MTLHLTLTHHWYDETASGRKRIEYRTMSPYWMRMLYERRDEIKRVRFSRGYTKTTQEFDVTLIDIGPCPIAGWAGNFYRIHFVLKNA